METNHAFKYLYKLTSGSFAKRIKNILNDIVSSNQTSLLQDIFIEENTRLVYDIMQYCEEHKVPGFLMLIDFEKVFDSLSFIGKTLSFLNFGEMVLEWIKLFLYNTEVFVQVYGFLSDYFVVKRGCRRAVPIPAYIFILCTQIPNIRIKMQNTSRE